MSKLVIRYILTMNQIQQNAIIEERELNTVEKMYIDSCMQFLKLVGAV